MHSTHIPNVYHTQTAGLQKDKENLERSQRKKHLIYSKFKIRINAKELFKSIQDREKYLIH